ncbi:hypothetical protein GCM10010404_39770 [Nonomuraea africana]
MGVAVDEPRRDEAPRRVDHLRRLGPFEPSDRFDPLPGDPDVRPERRSPGAVEHPPATDDHVERHTEIQPLARSGVAATGGDPAKIAASYRLDGRPLEKGPYAAATVTLQSVITVTGDHWVP